MRTKHGGTRARKTGAPPGIYVHLPTGRHSARNIHHKCARIFRAKNALQRTFCRLYWGAHLAVMLGSCALHSLRWVVWKHGNTAYGGEMRLYYSFGSSFGNMTGNSSSVVRLPGLPGFLKIPISRKRMGSRLRAFSVTFHKPRKLTNISEGLHTHNYLEYVFRCVYARAIGRPTIQRLNCKARTKYLASRNGLVSQEPAAFLPYFWAILHFYFAFVQCIRQGHTGGTPRAPPTSISTPLPSQAKKKIPPKFFSCVWCAPPIFADRLFSVRRVHDLPATRPSQTTRRSTAAGV